MQDLEIFSVALNDNKYSVVHLKAGVVCTGIAIWTSGMVERYTMMSMSSPYYFGMVCYTLLLSALLLKLDPFHIVFT